MSFGFGINHDWGKFSFGIIGIDFHSHPKGEQNDCPFLVGLDFFLLGIHLAVGIWK